VIELYHGEHGANFIERGYAPLAESQWLIKCHSKVKKTP
jgi:hypothetical protein